MLMQLRALKEHFEVQSAKMSFVWHRRKKLIRSWHFSERLRVEFNFTFVLFDVTIKATVSGRLTGLADLMKDLIDIRKLFFPLFFNFFRQLYYSDFVENDFNLFIFACMKKNFIHILKCK